MYIYQILKGEFTWNSSPSVGFLLLLSILLHIDLQLPDNKTVFLSYMERNVKSKSHQSSSFCISAYFLVSRENVKNGTDQYCCLFKVNRDCNNYTAKHNIELNCIYMRELWIYFCFLLSFYYLVHRYELTSLSICYII